MGASAVTATVADLADVPGARWATLDGPATFYLDHGWMTAMGSTVGERTRVVLVAGAGGRLLAGFPVHLQSAASYGRYDPWSVLFGDERVTAAAGLDPVLTSVAPGFVAGVRWAAGLGDAEAAAAADDGLAAMEALAADEGAPATAFLYVPEGEDPVLEQALDRRGYAAGVVGADCRLAVPWADFDEYLATRTRTRRSSVRAEVRRFREAGLAVEAAGVEALTDDLAPLHAEWRARHGPGVDVEALRRQYDAVRRHAGAAMRMFVARRGGETLAFAQFYEHDGVLYSRAAGFRYAALDGAFAYFNVIFYEPLRWAMANGVGEIRYSMESSDAKVGRGCHLVPLRLHVLAPGAPPGVAAALAAVDRRRRDELDEVRNAHRAAPGGGGR